MNAMLDDSLVGLMLLVSMGYAFAKLAPRNARRRVLAWLGAMLEHLPAALLLHSFGERVVRAAGDTAAGCGGCDNCGSESRASSAGAEVSVPVASIGRMRPSRLE
jgi:Family of unknown function (DUF6587)